MDFMRSSLCGDSATLSNETAGTLLWCREPALLYFNNLFSFVLHLSCFASLSLVLLCVSFFAMISLCRFANCEAPVRLRQLV